MCDDERWNEERAAEIIGRHIIIGLTRLTATNEVIELIQMHGDVVVADEKRGIGIRLSGTGEMYWFPPDTEAIQDAPPGEYRFRSTGEVVVNPELMATWTVTAPPDEP